MRPSIAIATLWSLASVSVLLFTAPAFGVSTIGPLLTLAAPVLLIAYASRFACTMQGGLLARDARDWGRPVPPAIIAIIGWLVLAVQSAFLVTRLR